MYMYNYIEMARVTGVPMSYLLTRGQSIKVFSQILRKCRQRNLIVPNMKVCLNSLEVEIRTCSKVSRDSAASLLHVDIMLGHVSNLNMRMLQYTPGQPYKLAERYSSPAPKF